MSDKTMEELLKAHFAKMQEIENGDIEHTRQVQGMIKHVAERCVANDLKVADELKTEKETTA